MSARKKFLGSAAATVVAIVAVTGTFAVGSSAGRHDGARVIDAQVLAPVQRPFTGTTNAIRGVGGGGVPWVIAHGELEVRANGRVKMEVEGLVIDPAETANPNAGKNPVALFKVIVSCLSTDAAGAPVTVNVSTPTAPADIAGNSELEAVVALPSPCYAPIAFVTSGGGAWFAVTGR
jgi:hypothetical protein